MFSIAGVKTPLSLQTMSQGMHVHMLVMRVHMLVMFV
jgi:hypothetical protein